MKTLGDAILLRNRMIEALDVADNHPDEAERRAMLTVVVAGGGFAGAETAGAVNDLLREAIHFYPNLREGMLRIVLVHHGEVILPELSESLGRYAETQLKRRGVEIRLKTGVAGYDGKQLTLSEGTKIITRWSSGPPASHPRRWCPACPAPKSKTEWW
jgi:NADH dehydrogenase